MDFQISIIIYQEKTFLSAFLPLAGERVVSMLYGAFRIAAFKLLLLSWAANHCSFYPFSGCRGGGGGGGGGGQSRELGARALPSGVYPAGKLQ